MSRKLRITYPAAAGAALLLLALPASADDKDLLRRITAPPNMMIVFGNSQTTEQPIAGATSAWDGDADSPASKMGAAKVVVRQFVNDNHTAFNIGLTTFAHNPNVGSITITGKHWLYAPLTTDYPAESWNEPAGTIERWGPNGEGPCTSQTVPACTDRSPNFITLPANATIVGPFFGVLGAQTAIIYLDGTAKNASKRILITVAAGRYGDAFTDGTLSAYPIAGTHSMEVTKVYQEKAKGNWSTKATTPNGNTGTVTISYVPPATLPKTSDLFVTSGTGAGQELGFLNDPRGDYDVNASCSGWEFQSNSSPLPLIKVPRDYSYGQTCLPPQNSYPCVTRLLRYQSKLVQYDQFTGAFATVDPDNPGYTGTGSKYADGCDSTLMGAVDIGLDVTENQAILTTRNGSQAPIKNLLTDIYNYFSKPAIDGFSNGKRTDDPNATCRVSAVILVYDNFNGCQNDNCSTLTSQVLTKLKQINVPVYVIGFGTSAQGTSNTGVCIAQNTGAILPDGSPGYFPVTSADGLARALRDIASLINEATKIFAATSVAGAQAAGDQAAYFASFNAAKERSIWNGRLNAYKLDAGGNLQMGTTTITDPADPFVGVTVPAPSNNPASLMWNAGQNLVSTPGTGANTPSAVLAPGASLSTGSYQDISNDGPSQTIPTSFYPGRKIVFSLPQSLPSPLVNLPLPASDAVPENRYDLTYTTGASWWPTLKALLGPQTAPPAVLSPVLTDSDAGDSLRFLWGDRDAVLASSITDISQKYLGWKLGDIFHSAPVLVGQPNNYALFSTNRDNYQAFTATYTHRRRVLIAGANDGLLHVFDAGVWDRTPSACDPLPDNSPGHCYDQGTGAELFAFAPRSIMQAYKPLKDAVGPQTKRDEWTVDGSPTAADVFIDAGHSGTPDPTHRAWHTVLVGSMREGSAFEGTTGAAPADSQGSYYALDITQPDELVVSGNMVGPPASPYTTAAPRCLNASGDASCGKDANDPTVRASQPARAWPSVLWEIQDTGDLDATGSPGAGYTDMGETWSKPSVGRVRICTANCGSLTTPLPVFEDHEVAIFGGGFDRERMNRRGNWLYMVDVETGKTLYRANSSCGINAVGCTPTYFGSIPSDPAVLDVNGDGILDMIYVGDQKGQLWRVDLTDLRRLVSPPGGRFDNQIDFSAGSGKPFLLFQAPQPTDSSSPTYPIYYRPAAVNLGYTTGGRPALGIAFGTGDRDDILGRLVPASLGWKERYYYVVDNNNVVTRTEADLLDIASPTAASATTSPANGWFLELNAGERVITNTLVISGAMFFSTFNPNQSGGSTPSCNNTTKCSTPAGTDRFYGLLYSTGNAYLGASDRGATQSYAGFLTDPVFFLSSDHRGNIIFSTANSVKKEAAPSGRKITIKSWKEGTKPR